jgi:heat shock protein HtpX
MDNLFSTHPDLNNRIAQLERIAAAMGSPSRTRGPWSDGGAYEPQPATAPVRAGWRVPSAGSAPDRPRGPWG